LYDQIKYRGLGLGLANSGPLFRRSIILKVGYFWNTITTNPKPNPKADPNPNPNPNSNPNLNSNLNPNVSTVARICTVDFRNSGPLE